MRRAACRDGTCDGASIPAPPDFRHRPQVTARWQRGNRYRRFRVRYRIGESRQTRRGNVALRGLQEVHLDLPGRTAMVRLALLQPNVVRASHITGARSVRLKLIQVTPRDCTSITREPFALLIRIRDLDSARLGNSRQRVTNCKSTMDQDGCAYQSRAADSSSTVDSSETPRCARVIEPTCQSSKVLRRCRNTAVFDRE